MTAINALLDLFLQVGIADPNKFNHFMILMPEPFGKPGKPKGNNIFDQQPEPAEFNVCCGLVVRTSSLVDWQGPYYYVSGRFRWN